MDAPAMRLASKIAEPRLPIPGERDDYKQARKALMADEIELKRQDERIAEKRRAPPSGPMISKDYFFVDKNSSEVGLPELFGATPRCLPIAGRPAPAANGRVPGVPPTSVRWAPLSG